MGRATAERVFLSTEVASPTRWGLAALIRAFFSYRSRPDPGHDSTRGSGQEIDKNLARSSLVGSGGVQSFTDGVRVRPGGLLESHASGRVTLARPDLGNKRPDP